MDKVRGIKKIIAGTHTSDGAGVKLSRIYGQDLAALFDPFLLLDEFYSKDPRDYIAGFPWHPHRGIETVTYLISGTVEHGDSLGNKGVITDGDCQWMTAGSGIIHMEMPQESELMWGYQLWVNLSAKDKMIPPKYRDVKADTVKSVDLAGKGTVRIISGTCAGVTGPVKGISVDPVFMDVELKRDQEFVYDTDPEHNVFIYIVDGSGCMEPDSEDMLGKRNLVAYNFGDQLIIRSGDTGLRCLLFAGKPLGEPVAWGGSIVMNTREQLQEAYQEFRDGNFIKVGKSDL